MKIARFKKITLVFIGLITFIVGCSVDIPSIGKEADDLFKIHKYEKAEAKYLLILKRGKEKEYLNNANLKLSEIYYHYAVTAYDEKKYKTALTNLSLSLKHNKLNKKVKKLKNRIEYRKKVIGEYVKEYFEKIYTPYLEGAVNMGHAITLGQEGDMRSFSIYFAKALNNFLEARKYLRQNKIAPEEFEDINPYPIFDRALSKSIDYITLTTKAIYYEDVNLISKSRKLYNEILELAPKAKAAFLKLSERIDEIMR